MELGLTDISMIVFSSFEDSSPSKYAALISNHWNDIKLHLSCNTKLVGVLNRPLILTEKSYQRCRKIDSISARNSSIDLCVSYLYLQLKTMSIFVNRCPNLKLCGAPMLPAFSSFDLIDHFPAKKSLRRAITSFTLASLVYAKVAQVASPPHFV